MSCAFDSAQTLFDYYYCLSEHSHCSHCAPCWNGHRYWARGNESFVRDCNDGCDDCTDKCKAFASPNADNCLPFNAVVKGSVNQSVSDSDILSLTLECPTVDERMSIAWAHLIVESLHIGSDSNLEFCSEDILPLVAGQCSQTSTCTVRTNTTAIISWTECLEAHADYIDILEVGVYCDHYETIPYSTSFKSNEDNGFLNEQSMISLALAVVLGFALAVLCASSLLIRAIHRSSKKNACLSGDDNVEAMATFPSMQQVVRYMRTGQVPHQNTPKVSSLVATQMTSAYTNGSRLPLLHDPSSQLSSASTSPRRGFAVAGDFGGGQLMPGRGSEPRRVSPFPLSDLRQSAAAGATQRSRMTTRMVEVPILESHSPHKYAHVVSVLENPIKGGGSGDIREVQSPALRSAKQSSRQGVISSMRHLTGVSEDFTPIFSMDSTRSDVTFGQPMHDSSGDEKQQTEDKSKGKGKASKKKKSKAKDKKQKEGDKGKRKPHSKFPSVSFGLRSKKKKKRQASEASASRMGMRGALVRMRSASAQQTSPVGRFAESGTKTKTKQKKASTSSSAKTTASSSQKTEVWHSSATDSLTASSQSSTVNTASLGGLNPLSAELMGSEMSDYVDPGDAVSMITTLRGLSALSSLSTTSPVSAERGGRAPVSKSMAAERATKEAIEALMETAKKKTKSKVTTATISSASDGGESATESHSHSHSTKSSTKSGSIRLPNTSVKAAVSSGDASVGIGQGHDELVHAPFSRSKPGLFTGTFELQSGSERAKTIAEGMEKLDSLYLKHLDGTEPRASIKIGRHNTGARDSVSIRIGSPESRHVVITSTSEAHAVLEEESSMVEEDFDKLEAAMQAEAVGLSGLRAKSAPGDFRVPIKPIGLVGIATFASVPLSKGASVRVGAGESITLDTVETPKPSDYVVTPQSPDHSVSDELVVAKGRAHGHLLAPTPLLENEELIVEKMERLFDDRSATSSSSSSSSPVPVTPEMESKGVDSAAAGVEFGDDSSSAIVVGTESRKLQKIEFDHVSFKTSLGRGYYSHIYLAEFGGGKYTAKKFKKEDLSMRRLKEFIKLIDTLVLPVSHPNIQQHVAYTMKPFCLLSEYMQGGSVGSYLQKCQEQGAGVSNEDRLDIAFQAASGLAFLHSRAIVHKDIRAQNIQVRHAKRSDAADGRIHVCLCEFGMRDILAEELSSDSTYVSYTLHDDSVDLRLKWMAPEVLEYFGFSEKSDVYSFGITFWELITGNLPYAQANAVDTAVGVLAKGERPIRHEFIEEKMWALMCQCWHKEADERPQMPAVVETLRQWLVHESDSVGSAETDSEHSDFNDFLSSVAH